MAVFDCFGQPIRAAHEDVELSGLERALGEHAGIERFGAGIVEVEVDLGVRLPEGGELT